MSFIFKSVKSALVLLATESLIGYFVLPLKRFFHLICKCCLGLNSNLKMATQFADQEN